jgi:uncharacterized protein
VVPLRNERVPVGDARIGLKPPAASGARVPLALAALLATCACAPPGGVAPGGVTFDSATVWVRQGSDSARAAVEVASTRAQHEVGLAGRTTLAPDAGMLFLFDPPRTADEGFWMWRTTVALDIAFIGADGVIQSVQSMEPCAAASRDDCPGYFSEAPYAAALEVSRGWFERHRLGVGASVRVDTPGGLGRP